jgi:hypothetical protein
MVEVQWLKPTLVGQFEFPVDADNHLRHSKFVGLRVDKACKDAVWNIPQENTIYSPARWFPFKHKLIVVVFRTMKGDRLASSKNSRCWRYARLATTPTRSRFSNTSRRRSPTVSIGSVYAALARLEQRLPPVDHERSGGAAWRKSKRIYTGQRTGCGRRATCTVCAAIPGALPKEDVRPTARVPLLRWLLHLSVSRTTRAPKCIDLQTLQARRRGAPFTRTGAVARCGEPVALPPAGDGSSRSTDAGAFTDTRGDIRYAMLVRSATGHLVLTIVGLSWTGIATPHRDECGGPAGEGVVDPNRAPAILRSTDRSVATARYPTVLQLSEGSTRMQVEAC